MGNFITMYNLNGIYDKSAAKACL